MTIPWTDEAKKRAKEHGCYLVKILIQGKHAGHGRIDFSGDVSVEMGQKLQALMTEIILDQCQRDPYGPPSSRSTWKAGEKDKSNTHPDREQEFIGFSMCDAPGCSHEATSRGFIAGIRSNFCDEHAGKYSMLRDPEGE